MRGIPKNRGAVKPVSYSFPTHAAATIIVHVSSIKQSTNRKKHDIETVAGQIGCVREGGREVQGPRNTTRRRRCRGETYLVGQGSNQEETSLQIEILTDTRPTSHNHTQAAPHSVRPYSVAAVVRASGWVWASSAVVPFAATEPRRALAPAQYTALGSACAACRDCMPAGVVAVLVVVLGCWGIGRA